jgi:hypothetical protein
MGNYGHFLGTFRAVQYHFFGLGFYFHKDHGKVKIKPVKFIILKGFLLWGANKCEYKSCLNGGFPESK